MKKILFAAMAALAITSCSQNEEIEAPSQKSAIDFTTAVGKAARAADTDNNNFKAFTVNSYITDADYAGGALGAAYMNGVAYTGTQGTWKTENKTDYYWPSLTSGSKVQFFAYPTPVDGNITFNADSAWPTLTFTVADAASAQQDLVVACATDMTSTSSGVTDGKLTLTFKHILTKINFSVTIDKNYTYTINSITINGAKGTSGVYTFASDVATGTWSDLGDAPTTGYSYSINSSATADSNGVIDLSTTDGSLMLLPQSLNGVTIEVDYTTQKNTTELFSGIKTVTLTSADKWEVGKNIRYNLTLPVGAEKISVDTNVSAWEDETSTSETPVTPPTPAA